MVDDSAVDVPKWAGPVVPEAEPHGGRLTAQALSGPGAATGEQCSRKQHRDDDPPHPPVSP